MKKINIPNDSPVYYVEDAAKYIRAKTYIHEQVIREILDGEEDYMRSIGLVTEVIGDGKYSN